MKLDMFYKSVPIGSMGLLFFTYRNGGFLQIVNVNIRIHGSYQLVFKCHGVLLTSDYSWSSDRTCDTAWFILEIDT